MTRTTRLAATTALTALTAATLLPAVAAAQTGPDLLLKPLPKDYSIDHVTSALILETTDLEDGAGTISLDYFETEGRFPLPVDDDSILKKAQARIGYAYDLLLLDSDGAASGLAGGLLDDQLHDISVGYGMGLFQSKDETIVAGATIGVGYAAAGDFGDANGYYGLANFAVGKEFRE